MSDALWVYDVWDAKLGKRIDWGHFFVFTCAGNLSVNSSTYMALPKTPSRIKCRRQIAVFIARKLYTL